MGSSDAFSPASAAQRAVVDHQRAAVARAHGDVADARGAPLGDRDQRADVFTGQRALDDARLGAARDQHRGPLAGRQVRRLQLARHAAGAARGAAVGARQRRVVDARQLGDARRRGIAARVGGVEPADVGQQHQQVGVQADRDARRQPVVVAERGARRGGLDGGRDRRIYGRATPDAVAGARPARRR